MAAEVSSDQQVALQDNHDNIIIQPAVVQTDIEQAVIHGVVDTDHIEQADLHSPIVTLEGHKSEQHTNNTIDMLSLMDVITTYKCKLCGFTSNHPDNIGAHVRAVHMVVADEESQTTEDTLVIDHTQNESTPASKELYLCGQCSLDFDNIDDCKNHMIRDHNISISALEEQPQELSECPGEDVAFLPNKVSVGTQVFRKKAGRKRKQKDIENMTVSKEKDDWSDVEIIETSGKRRVRPPKALTQLYVLSERRTPSSTVKVNTRQYILTCPKTSCLARFKTAAALELHKTCHVSRVPGMKRTSKPYSCPTCAQE